MIRRVIAITVLAAAVASASYAQAPVPNKPLADVAKEEEARRKTVRKPAKVYTNSDLKPDTSSGTGVPPAPPSTSPASGSTVSGNTTPANASPSAPAATAQKDQAYWAGRMTQLRAALQRSQIFADSLQSRINALQTDFVNRDDPAQRAVIERDRNTALAELERVKKEVEQQTQAIAALEDEARRAGVPPGWLRPGA